MRHVGGSLWSKQSTAIRAAISDGDLARAELLLGRPVAWFGTVVRGEGRGRQLGFATAYLDLHHETRPHAGVWAVRVRVGSIWVPAVLNIGIRPTFGPDGDLYVPGFYNHAIGRYDGVTGDYIEAFTPADGSLLAPRTLIFAGDELLVSSERRSAVLRFDGRTGAYRGELVAAKAGGLLGAAGMVRLADASLAVVSLEADALLHFSALGEPWRRW